MSNYRYTIDESNAVRIWPVEASLDSPPTLLQPSFPDNTAWTKAQAEEWVVVFISALEDSNPEFISGNGPDEIKVLRSVS